MRQIVLFFGLLIILTIIKFPYGNYIEGYVQDALKEARKQNITIDYTDFTFKLPANITLRNLGIVFPTAQLPLPLFIDTFTASYNILPLFILHNSVDIDLTAYSGQVHGEISKGLFSDEVTFDSTIQDVSLIKHPLFGHLGAAGTLDAEVNLETVLQRTLPKEGSLKIDIKDGSYVGGHTINGLIKLPAVEDLTANVTARIKSLNKADVSLTLSSSVGEVTSQGVITFNTNALVTSFKGNARINLTSIGKQHFGGYLALAAQSNIDNPADSWSMSIDYVPGQNPKVSVKPL
jgi:type II secretion system protein N